MKNGNPMSAELNYRTAIVALRNRAWEEAGRYLLTLAAENPEYRDVSRVLEQLEQSHPIEYWCATFEVACGREQVETAQTAVSILQQLDPHLARLTSMEIQLSHLASGGTIEVPVPSERILTDDWNADEDEVFNQWLETPDLLDEDDVPDGPFEVKPVDRTIVERVVAYFGDGNFDDAELDNIDLDDMYAEDDTTILVEGETVHAPPMSIYDTKPLGLPEDIAIEVEASSDLANGTVQTDSEPQQATIIVHESSSPRRRLPWFAILNGLLLVVVIGVFLYVQDWNAIFSPPDIQDISGLVDLIDREMLRISEPEEAIQTLDSLKPHIQAIVVDDFELQAALHDWIDVGEEAMIVAQRMNDICVEHGARSTECEEVVTEHAAVAEDVQSMHTLVCDLTPCE